MPGEAHPSSLPDLLERAVARHEAGDLATATRLYLEILQREPRHFEALHRLGVARAQAGDAAAAVRHLTAAIAVNPQSAEAHVHLAHARMAVGETEAALGLYDQALELRPDFPEALYSRGNALQALQRHAEAVESYDRALALAPERPEILTNRGNALHDLKRFDQALADYDRALALRPDAAMLHNNRGNTLREMKRHAEALAEFERALALDPRYLDARVNRGNVLQDLRRHDEALAEFDRALAAKPDFAAAHYNRGNALMELKRPQEALASYDRALALKHDHADALNGCGDALLELFRLEEAARCFERAIEVKPREPTAYWKLGVVRREQGRWEEALRYHERALDLDPGSAAAEYCLALACLFGQEFERAWPHHERRLDTPSVRGKLRDVATVERYEQLPHWRGPGEALEGGVAIWGEQGIGDQVLFSTLIPELIAARVPFAYEVDWRLLPAYARAFPGSRFVAREESPREELTQASRVLLAGSLPGLFRRSRASFARQPRRLLSALPERVAHFRQRMDAPEPGLKVAISWRSAREGRMGRIKSVELMQFAPLLELEGVRFVDVQYGDTRAERQAVEEATGVRLLHFDEVDYYRDLEELLAILEACDLLITTSNANAHFAGALGTPVWLLYPAERPPFHYWAHDGSHRCLWYPSVEIVSAPQLADWASLIEHVKERLDRELTRSSRHAS